MTDGREGIGGEQGERRIIGGEVVIWEELRARPLSNAIFHHGSEKAGLLKKATYVGTSRVASKRNGHAVSTSAVAPARKAPHIDISLLTTEDKDVTDEPNRVIWKSCSQNRIGLTVKNDCNQELVDALKLQEAFGIAYSKTAIPGVLDFALGFDGQTDTIQFRGIEVKFDTQLLRDAFNLPRSESYPIFRPTWPSAQLGLMFKEPAKGGNPYSSDRFRTPFQHWVPVIRLVQEVLLGKNKPTQLHSKDMWYFYAHWWSLIPSEYLVDEPEKPNVMPDWARLLADVLKREILLLKTHVLKVRNGQEKKRLSCYCGIAVTRILEHLKYDIHDLRKEGVAARQTDRQEQNREAEVSVTKRTRTQTQEDDPGTAHLKSLADAVTTSLQDTPFPSVVDELERFGANYDEVVRKVKRAEVAWKGKETAWQRKKTELETDLATEKTNGESLRKALEDSAASNDALAKMGEEQRQIIAMLQRELKEQKELVKDQELVNDQDAAMLQRELKEQKELVKDQDAKIDSLLAELSSKTTSFSKLYHQYENSYKRNFSLISSLSGTRR